MNDLHLQKHREYYTRHASSYDATWAGDPTDEHYVASAILVGLLDLYKITSLLDVGCGTGRALTYLRDHTQDQNIRLIGLDPVDALLAECEKKGFSSSDLTCGDACKMPFEDSSIDCVSLFGVLHHIRTPEVAIGEAFRVASKMVYISDHNVYGMGSGLSRFVKRQCRRCGLTRPLFFAMTRGKGFHDTDWDGVFYPFSLLDHYEKMKTSSTQILSFSTKTSAVDLRRDASHLALAAIK